MPLTRRLLVVVLLCVPPCPTERCFGEIINDAQHIHTAKAGPVMNGLRGQYATRAELQIGGPVFNDPRHLYPNPDPQANPSHHRGLSDFTFTQFYHREKGNGRILPGERNPAVPFFTLGLLTEDNCLFPQDKEIWKKSWNVSFTRPKNPDFDIKAIDIGFTFKEVGGNFEIEWFPGREGGPEKGINASFNGDTVSPVLNLTYGDNFDFDNGMLTIKGVIDSARRDAPGFGRVRTLGSVTVIEPANAFMGFQEVTHRFDAPVYDVLYTVPGVPEIDPASCGSVVAFVVAAFGFVERRARRRSTTAPPAPAAPAALAA